MTKLVGLMLAVATGAVFAANVSENEKRRLFEPTPSELQEEAAGRIYIYEGLTDRDIQRAMEEEFNRVESMMFIRVKPTDEKGEVLKDEETGEDVTYDDGC
jgi:hypothetical protein